MPNENLDFPQAPPDGGLSEGVANGDTAADGGGEADRSSLERLWGDELYEEEDDDGDIEESDIGGDDNIRVRNGEDLLSIRKECLNLNQRILSRDEEVKQLDIEVPLGSIQIRFSCGGPSHSWRNISARRTPSGRRLRRFEGSWREPDCAVTGPSERRGS